jgi:hypothetical protein
LFLDLFLEVLCGAYVVCGFRVLIFFIVELF